MLLSLVAAWTSFPPVYAYVCVCVCQTTLAEQHVERIHSLEVALRQRETSLQKLSAQLRSKDAHQSQLHASLDVPRGGFCSVSAHNPVISKKTKKKHTKYRVNYLLISICNYYCNTTQAKCPFKHIYNYNLYKWEIYHVH